jgi:hypothetical protein
MREWGCHDRSTPQPCPLRYRPRWIGINGSRPTATGYQALGDQAQSALVAAVRGGLLSLEEACERYTLTVDEYLSWQRSIDRYGLPGLRATRVQDYRE